LKFGVVFHPVIIPHLSNETVIPANAGIPFVFQSVNRRWDARLRGHDVVVGFIDKIQNGAEKLVIHHWRTSCQIKLFLDYSHFFFP
jgi:hypothetical protein